MEFFKFYKGDFMNADRFVNKFKRNRNDENISINELRNILKTNIESILLDVRSPQEYNEGHLNRSS